MQNSFPVQLEQSAPVRRVFWLILAALFAIELILLRLSLSGLEELGWARVLWAFLISSLLPLGLIYRLLVNVWPVIFANYNLYEDQLNINARGKHMVIKFSDLVQVKFDTLITRLWGGYKLEHQSGKVVRIFSSLQGSELILEQLKQVRPGFVPEEKIQPYLKQIRIQKMIWQKLFKTFTKPWLLISKFLLAPLIVATLTWQFMEKRYVFDVYIQFLDWFLLLALFHLVLGFFVFELQNMILYLSYSFSILNDDFKRSPKSEAWIERGGQALFFLSSAAFGICWAYYF